MRVLLVRLLHGSTCDNSRVGGTLSIPHNPAVKVPYYDLVFSTIANFVITSATFLSPEQPVVTAGA